jgi:hypothetical protein
VRNLTSTIAAIVGTRERALKAAVLSSSFRGIAALLTAGRLFEEMMRSRLILLALVALGVLAASGVAMVSGQAAD